jgi:hypothetical protein
MRWAGHVARMEKTNAYRILVGNWKEWDHLEDLDVGGRIILESILERGWGGLDKIDLAQDRDQWRALVNTVMNLWVP